MIDFANNDLTWPPDSYPTIDSATVAGVTAPVPELASYVMLLMRVIVILGGARYHKRGKR